MNKDVMTPFLPILAIVLSFLLTPGSMGATAAETAESEACEPQIILSLADKFGEIERPPVLFRHDKHAEALKEKGCTVCHQASDEEVMIYRYPAEVKGDSRNAYRAAYHKECIGCHRNRDIVGIANPPATCGECHVRKELITKVVWPDGGFDYYSHNVHAEIADNCELCHHTGDMASCRDCHRQGEDSEANAFKEAAHSSCIHCHLEYEAGPLSCGGCHSETKRWTAEDIADASRPDIGQPDQVIIAADRASMSGVAFNHERHEGYTTACRTCHHNSTNTCGSCHNIAGAEKGAMVNLAFAYHEGGSERSCVGCHAKQKTASECAGCHHSMKSGLNDNSCRNCHSGSVPLPFSTGLSAVSVLPKNLPAEIAIDKIQVEQDKYLPVRFSHQAHVRKLTAVSNQNSLARYFHSDSMTVCAGCHHHSPLEPQRAVPPCSTCHRLSLEPRNQVPTLYGAYHQQCLGCHDNMSAGTTTCTGCHQERQIDLQASAIDGQ